MNNDNKNRYNKYKYKNMILTELLYGGNPDTNINEHTDKIDKISDKLYVMDEVSRGLSTIGEARSAILTIGLATAAAVGSTGVGLPIRVQYW